MDIVSYLLGKNAGGGGGGGSLQELDVTPTDQEQVLLPEEGYVGFSQVTVAAIQPPVVPPEAGTLTGIVVGTLPKISYVEGDALDLTGCVILANYSNGYQYDVTAYCTFTCNDPVTYSDTSIVVTFETETLTIPITVAGKPVEAPAETKGLWHFDDGTDKNEVNGKGTSTSGLVDPQSIVMTSGKFDMGLADRVYLNYNNSLGLIHGAPREMMLSEVTIEFWFKPTPTSSQASAVYIYLWTYDETNYRVGIQVALNGAVTNKSNAFVMPSPTVATRTITINEWHHFALVNNKTERKIYIDGILFLTSTATLGTSVDATYGTVHLVTGGMLQGFDEVLLTESVKYVTDFEPPHAPYYLANQGGE